MTDGRCIHGPQSYTPGCWHDPQVFYLTPRQRIEQAEQIERDRERIMGEVMG